MKRLLLILLLLMSYKGFSQSIFYQNDQFILNESDKFGHYKMGLVSGSIGYCVGYELYDSKIMGFVGSMVFSLGSGLIKEGYDSIGYGSVEGRDILATTMGGLTIGLTIPLNFTNYTNP